MIELTTTALFLLGIFYGNPAESDKKIENVPIVNEAVQPLTLEEYVREYFTETPILAEIAKCESDFRHIDRNGNVLRGEQTNEDVGVMQINEFYHEKRADKLGFDILALEDNLAYAKWLYTKEGLTPWYSSEKCWQKYERLAEVKNIPNTD